MPFNTRLVDASTANPPIPRVYFDRWSEAKGFTDALMGALQVSASLIYIGSTEITKNDHDAAAKIAWLRKNTFGTSAVPSDNDITGALGEWALLRYIGKNDDRVKTVSLVSLYPVSDPDFIVVQHDPITQSRITTPFDIKTTAAKEPAFVLNPEKHGAKGNPNIIGVVLNKKKDEADIFLVRAGELTTQVQLEAAQRNAGRAKLETNPSLKANLVT